ncbi:MAG TPA: adenylate/guanylate cyclase domain-containing protein [Phycisphaerales bacterium]|nr:adenylate/guanylate cyclase domain-containing protein [Phycisphaerales bacterium]
MPRGRAAVMRRRQWGLGAAATLVIATAQLTGLIDRRLELFWLDLRATWFDSGNPPPSAGLAVVAIDDQAIRAVGRWPWDRRVLARALDELRAAGARVIALDLLLDDPQPPRPLVARDGAVALASDDDRLADAIRAHGRVVLATNFSLATAGPGGALAVSYESVARLLGREPGLLALPEEELVRALARALLPADEALTTAGTLIDDIRRHVRAHATLAACRPATALGAAPEDAPWPRSRHPAAPLPTLGSAAARLGNVTFDTYDADGKLRRVPAVVEFENQLWPLLGLAATLEYLGLGMDQVTLTPAALLLHGAEPARRLRLLEHRPRGRPIAGLHYLAWPRARRDWLAQFETAPGAAGRGAVSLSIAAVLEPSLLLERTVANISELDRAVATALEMGLVEAPGYAERAAAIAAEPPGSAGFRPLLAAQAAVWERVALEAAGVLEFAGDPAETDEQDRRALQRYAQLAQAVPALRAQVERGLAGVDEARARATALLRGRICFVGVTFTGSAADVVPTSIHPRTPGVFVHAALANSLLTGLERVPAHPALNLLAVLALGLLATSLAVRGLGGFEPLVLLAVLALFFLACGLAWTHAGLMLGFAGPALAGIAATAAVMVHRLLVEQVARRRTEERFRSYVSPAVVDILVNNPALNSMAPQHRELTVMFTDIAGFTATAERLGSHQTARLLGAYLGAMTDVLQRTGATLDKYLGDGIMAFWGAPLDDPDHAASACHAALAMLAALEELNARGVFGGAGRLDMRVGIASGELMVGDFGNPPRNSSYTVLGDAANLAARLESANKQLGTRILCSARARELAGDRFLWRPVGLVRVLGKTHPEPLFEPLGSEPPADPRLAATARLWDELVAAFTAGDLARAERALAELGPSAATDGLAEFYRATIAEARRGPPADFDGTIVLTHK